MYVYTHAVVGGALGVWIKNTRHCIALGALGGVLPDVPMGAQIAYVIVSGADPWQIKWWKPTIIVSDAFHSLPLCALLLIVGWNRVGLRALSLAMIVHSGMDAVSHAITPEIKATYLWPLPWQLGRWVSVWDYRRSLTSVVPKPQEIVINALALSYLAYKFRQRARRQ